MKEYPFTYKGDKFVDRAYIFNYVQEGKKAQNRQFVLMNYTQKSITDGRILDSSYPQVAQNADVVPYYALGGPIYREIYVSINPESETYDPEADMLKMIPEGTTGSVVMSSLFSGVGYINYNDFTVEKIIPGSKKACTPC